MNQFKVEFEQKEYAILAEVDVQMLMQTKEFMMFFSQTSEQKSIHLATSTVKVYVIEEYEPPNDYSSPKIEATNMQ